MSVKVSDQNGDDLQAVVKKMPVMKTRKGFTSRIRFSILFGEGVEHVEVECKATNEVGEAVSTHTTRVKCKNNEQKSQRFKHLYFSRS